VRWLLNLAYMTLANIRPASPPNTASPVGFRVERQRPRFVDIAPAAASTRFHGRCVIVDDFDNDGLLDIVTSSYDNASPCTCSTTTATAPSPIAPPRPVYPTSSAG